MRILGFGPVFDVAGYEQNGHLLIDFGLDTPWVLDLPQDDQPLDHRELAAQRDRAYGSNVPAGAGCKDEHPFGAVS